VSENSFAVIPQEGPLLEEVELFTTLIAAASVAEDSLTTHEVDTLLGLVPQPRRSD
jgi:hypothetical protein